MAKKSGRQKLNHWLDKTVHELHDCGLLYSCILHTVVLLIMSLTFLVPEPLQTIRLKLSFDSDSSSLDIGSEPILDIQTMEDIPESESDIESDFNPENIAAIESSDIIETENIPPILDSLEPSESNEIMDLATEQLDQQVAIKEEVIPPPPAKAVAAKTGNKTTNSSTNEESGGNQLSSGDQAIVGAMGERLRMAGAKTGDIQISIGWNTIDDVDLHVKAVNGAGVSWINWMAPFGVDGGELDVDMNAAPDQLTNRAVENVYWPLGQSPQAEYIVGVHLFRNRTGVRSVPVSVVIKVGGKTKVFNVDCVSGMNVTEVTRFTKAN